MFLDNLPACTTIDPYDVFKPCHRNALIDTLNKDSNLNHPRYVITSGPRSRVLFALFQIRRIHVQGLGRQACRTAAIHAGTRQLPAGTRQHTISSVSGTCGGGWHTVANIPVSQTRDLLTILYQLYKYAAANVKSVTGLPQCAPISHTPLKC